MMEEHSSKKRVRDDSDELELEWPEVKRIKEDLLGFLDDSDPGAASHDLDSVMKSFQDEISASSSSPVPVVDLTSDSGESQHELGFLLEASDDDLGLPPSLTSINSLSEEANKDGKNGEIELVRVDSAESVGIGELRGFDEQLPSYDWFELGVAGNYTEYVGFDDGLFEYSNVCFDSSEVSDFFPYRLETLPDE